MLFKKLLILPSALLLGSCIHLAAEVATNNFDRQLPASPALKTPTVAEQNAKWCGAHDCSEPVTAPVNVLLDTHAHFAMGPGMRHVFSGKPWDLEHQPVWSDRLSEKMGIEAMRESGYGIVVVSLYANIFAIWPGDVPAAIRAELDQIAELLQRYPDDFTLATTSFQARQAVNSGKIVLVLHLEGAEWALRSQEDVAALYRAGVRSTNPIHLYDSWIGGADLQAGKRWVINPPGWGNSRTVNGRRENGTGLTGEGKELLRTLRDYGYIIDISHFSRQSLRDLAAMKDMRDAPLLNSHMPDVDTSTWSERGVDDEAFQIMRESGGLLGMVPTAHSPERVENFEGLCPGSVETYSAIYSEAVKRAGGMPIALATDFNGGIGHLRPTHGEDGCYPLEEAQTEFQKTGLADASYLPEVLEAMRKQGADVTPMYEASERFLQMWERAEKLKRF